MKQPEYTRERVVAYIVSYLLVNSHATVRTLAQDEHGKHYKAGSRQYNQISNTLRYLARKGTLRTAKITLEENRNHTVVFWHHERPKPEGLAYVESSTPVSAETWPYMDAAHQASAVLAYTKKFNRGRTLRMLSLNFNPDDALGSTTQAYNMLDQCVRRLVKNGAIEVVRREGRRNIYVVPEKANPPKRSTRPILSAPASVPVFPELTTPFVPPAPQLPPIPEPESEGISVMVNGVQISGLTLEQALAVARGFGSGT